MEKDKRKYKREKEPDLLPHVLKAVAKFKDPDGVSASKILRYILGHMKRPADKKEFAHPIQRALDTCVQRGLLREQNGKYYLRSNSTFMSSESEASSETQEEAMEEDFEETQTRKRHYAQQPPDDERYEQQQPKHRKHHRHTRDRNEQQSPHTSSRRADRNVENAEGSNNSENPEISKSEDEIQTVAEALMMGDAWNCNEKPSRKDNRDRKN